MLETRHVTEFSCGNMLGSQGGREKKSFTRFECGDWKWGHFRQHCAKEHRMGHTCDMKLIMQTVSVGSKCKLCEKIDTKKRRRSAEVERIQRWQREGSKYRESIQTSLDIIKRLDGELYELSCERNRRLSGLNIGQISPSSTLPKDKGSTISLPRSHDHQNENESEVHYRLVEKKNQMFGLPITFESIPGPATVIAIPDTGADENIISLSLALELGLEIDFDERHQIALGMINKKLIRCCGLVRTKCGFGMTSQLGQMGMSCVFRVSETTISPLIMSYTFLMETQTMSTYPNRLVSRFSSPFRFPRVRTAGRARERLRCSLDGQNIEAFPDTGSDVDVIGYNYAVRRGFTITPTKGRIMFADGSIQDSVGICSGQLAVGFDYRTNTISESFGTGETHSTNSDDKGISIPDSSSLEEYDGSDLELRNNRNVIATQFYVLQDINLDLLLGAGSLESLQVYTRHQDQLVSNPSQCASNSSLNRITLVGKVGEKLRCAAIHVFGSTERSIGNTRRGFPCEQALCAADQRENARREGARLEASRMTGDKKLKFEQLEAKKQVDYDEYRDWLQEAIDQERKRANTNEP